MWGRHDAPCRSGSSMSGRTPCACSSRRTVSPCSRCARTRGSAHSSNATASIPQAKLAETAAQVRALRRSRGRGRRRRRRGADHEPGPSGGERRRAARDDRCGDGSAPVRILSAQEEGRLAFIGALGSVHLPSRRRVAVVDVGGGSSQIVVGSGREGITWSGTIDLGSRRLTSRHPLERPADGGRAVRRARATSAPRSHRLDVPDVRTALVVGGSARALKRLVGGHLGSDELEYALLLLGRTTASELIEHHDVNPARAEVLAAGDDDPRRRAAAARHTAQGGARRAARGRGRRARSAPAGRLTLRQRGAPAVDARPRSPRDTRRAPRGVAPVRARSAGRRRRPSWPARSCAGAASATTASWCSPITSWRCLSASM